MLSIGLGWINSIFDHICQFMIDFQYLFGASEIHTNSGGSNTQLAKGGQLRKKKSKYFLILHWDIFFSKLIGTSRFTLWEGKEGFLHFLQNLGQPCTSSLKQKCRYIPWVHFIIYQLVQGCPRFCRNEVWKYVKFLSLKFFPGNNNNT